MVRRSHNLKAEVSMHPCGMPANALPCTVAAFGASPAGGASPCAPRWRGHREPAAAMGPGPAVRSGRSSVAVALRGRAARLAVRRAGPGAATRLAIRRADVWGPAVWGPAVWGPRVWGPAVWGPAAGVAVRRVG